MSMIRLLQRVEQGDEEATRQILELTGPGAPPHLPFADWRDRTQAITAARRIQTARQELSSAMEQVIRDGQIVER